MCEIENYQKHSESDQLGAAAERRGPIPAEARRFLTHAEHSRLFYHYWNLEPISHDVRCWASMARHFNTSARTLCELGKSGRIYRTWDRPLMPQSHPRVGFASFTWRITICMQVR